jgi:hypothetical protein
MSDISVLVGIEKQAAHAKYLQLLVSFIAVVFSAQTQAISMLFKLRLHPPPPLLSKV